MSSRSETFGLVNIEALASGLPVLATNSGGIPEIIKDNYNGLLFSREDFMEASRKLKLLYKSPELMKKLSENALEDVKNKYDYKTQTDKFFEFCNVVYNNSIKKST
jgi:glycosyltransferase involved in cell wall biosynthesis